MPATACTPRAAKARRASAARRRRATGRASPGACCMTKCVPPTKLGNVKSGAGDGAVHDHRVHASQPPRTGSRSGPARQQAAIAEAALAVDDHDLALAHQREVLQSIVADDDVGAIAQPPSGRRDPVASDEHRRRARRASSSGSSPTSRGRLCRVTRVTPRRPAAVAARDDGHAHPGGSEPGGQPGDQRRLAGAADGEIAHHHHGCGHLDAMPQAHAVQQAAHAHDCAVEPGEAAPATGAPGVRTTSSLCQHASDDQLRNSARLRLA